MINNNDKYQNPLCERYASAEIQHIFSNNKKFSTWRKLWVTLAEAEKELGLPIEDKQISQMRENIDNIDYDVAKKKEAEVRHDVMAHIHAFGEVAPDAKPIIHLGATSCFVGDNTDIIIIKEALIHTKKLLLKAIITCKNFAEKYKNMPSLAYTHFQAAQPTTIGKRATLWLQDLISDLARLNFEIDNLKLLGCKGTTGTSASFLELFEGDDKKCLELEKKICEKMGFKEAYPVSGQTYSRKADFNVLSVLASIAQSLHKFSNDTRLMSHLKEFDEPFEAGQIGSSAMAYKRNPMRSERIASLARYVICDLQNTAFTASCQWFERTLDDSANKRIAIPEAFLAIDGILSLQINILSGAKIYEKIIAKHLNEELPFMATENILMYCTKRGGDRQALHEAIRKHSIEANRLIKEEGADNKLIEFILNDKEFNLTKEEINELLNPTSFTGRASKQVDEFMPIVDEVLKDNSEYIDNEIEVKINV